LIVGLYPRLIVGLSPQLIFGLSPSWLLVFTPGWLLIFTPVDCWSLPPVECWSLPPVDCWSLPPVECWSLPPVDCWSLPPVDCWSLPPVDCWKCVIYVVCFVTIKWCHTTNKRSMTGVLWEAAIVYPSRARAFTSSFVVEVALLILFLFCLGFFSFCACMPTVSGVVHFYILFIVNSVFPNVL
jgi:hypothetical protein